MVCGEGELSLDVTYNLIWEIVVSRTDGIFNSCTDFKTVELLEI